MKNTLLCLLVLVAYHINAAGHLAMPDSSAEIIPPERRIEWDPGIPGGIPRITGPVENILDHGADPTGQQDSYRALVDAMNNLPVEGGVVFIPEGTYLVGSQLAISRNNLVFRGEGRKSRLMMHHQGNSIEVVTYRRGDWQSLPEGVTKGVTRITVEDGSAFTPGEFAEIEQDNDPEIMYTDPYWDQSWSKASVGQMFEVVSVNGNEITFRGPVHLNFRADLHARIRPQGLVTGVGFENLYIEKMVADGHTIYFKNSAFCWVKNIESNHTRRTHVSQSECLGNVIRDSYFHRSFNYGGGGSGYGVECGRHVTSTLVENNIFDSLRHAMIIQVGANGNVYGYNFSMNPVQGEGETYLNNGWIPPDISIHGHYPYMNLFEGNELEEIGIGDWWGPAGPGNTYFRNKVNGDGIIYHDESHYQNLVGNISTRIIDQDSKSMHQLEHGNVVDGQVQWDTAVHSRSLPYSCYLDSAPSFFDETNWPPFGPDAAMQTKLPARVRFENLPFLDVSADRRSTGQYEKIEFTINNGKTYDNPFDPEEVDVSGSFISPSFDTIRVNAFWNGQIWKLRFAGAETGQWKYLISVLDRDGTDRKEGRFTITESEEKGWIRPSAKNPQYLACDNGEPFFGVGMAVPWLIYDERYYVQPDLLNRLSKYGVNFINWLFTSWDILLLRDSYKTYSMADAEAFDRLIEDAEQNGIKLLLGIWIHGLLRDDPHPWSGFYNWESNPFNQLTTVDEFFSDSLCWVYQEKYYRYIIARWGYSSSIGMWHTIAEINGTNAIYDEYALTNDPRGWHYKINRYFQENDPFRHPTSASGSGSYDFAEGWELTDCPQAHEYPHPRDKIKENADRIAYWGDLLFHRYDKPVFIGEFGKYLYEEGKSESFLHNGLWAGVMSGSCATPLHWWGGQISMRPENFSTFNHDMLMQVKHIGDFVKQTQLARHDYTPLYSAPLNDRITLFGMDGGLVYGMRGDSMSMCWIYHFDEYSDKQFSDAGISFPSLTEGHYEVSFYNTWKGEWYEEKVHANTVGSSLTFTCPDFTGDLAVVLRRTGPVKETGQSHPVPDHVRVYPNPCGSSVFVDNLTDVTTVRLLGVRGNVLKKETVSSAGRIRFDLRPFAAGIYLVEVTGTDGSPRTYKVICSN